MLTTVVEENGLGKQKRKEEAEVGGWHLRGITVVENSSCQSAENWVTDDDVDY